MRGVSVEEVEKEDNGYREESWEGWKGAWREGSVMLARRKLLGGWGKGSELKCEAVC